MQPVRRSTGGSISAGPSNFIRVPRVLAICASLSAGRDGGIGGCAVRATRGRHLRDGAQPAGMGRLAIVGGRNWLRRMAGRLRSRTPDQQVVAVERRGDNSNPRTCSSGTCGLVPVAHRLLAEGVLFGCNPRLPVFIGHLIGSAGAKAVAAHGPFSGSRSLVHIPAIVRHPKGSNFERE